MPQTELVRELSSIYAADPDRNIVIKADRTLKYEQAREVIRQVREAKFKRVGLVTERTGTKR